MILRNLLLYFLILCSLTSYSQSQDKIPSESDTLYAGLCYESAGIKYRNGQTDSAVYLFSEVINIFPNDPASYYYRGFLMYKKNNYSDAITDFTKCIELNPQNEDDLNGDSYGFRGIVKLETKDYPGAISDLSEAIELGPHMGMYYYNRGNAKLDTEDYIGAISDYTKAMEADADYNIRSHTNRGVAKALSGDSQGACLDWEQAIRYGGKEALPLLERCK